MYARKRLLLLCVLCGWHHCKLDLQSVIVHCDLHTREKGEGTTLIRVKGKASHCHLERKAVKRDIGEAAIPITTVSADGAGGMGLWSQL